MALPARPGPAPARPRRGVDARRLDRQGVLGLSDDLGKCLVRGATPSDQTTFVIWAFGAMSAHPAVKQYSNFTDAQRTELNRAVGKLYERLLTVDCRKETIAA